MPIEVVRSEEELRTGVQRRAHERVVIRTRIVTEEITVTVPIRRQVLEIEQLPLEGDGPSASAADDVGPDVVEIVLHEERPVVEVVGTEVVPVERVRVIRSSRRVEVPVSAELRRERVDVVTDDGAGVAGGRPAPPIPGYEQMAVSQILPLLEGMGPDELAAVATYERARSARPGVLLQVEALRKAAS